MWPLYFVTQYFAPSWCRIIFLTMAYPLCCLLRSSTDLVSSMLYKRFCIVTSAFFINEIFNVCGCVVESPGYHEIITNIHSIYLPAYSLYCCFPCYGYKISHLAAFCNSQIIQKLKKFLDNFTNAP